MSMWGESNRFRDNYKVKYVVWPEDESMPRKEFKHRKRAFNYALSCGPGTTISKNEDYVGGSSFGGAEWVVDWAFPYKKKSDMKVYKYHSRRFGKPRRTNDNKRYFGFSYKIFTRMEYLDFHLWKGDKTMEEMSSVVKNLFKLFKKQGVDFDNPSEWMVDTWRGYCNNGIDTLSEVPWGYWSDRCNWGRAYTIYMCYMNTDNTNLFEKLDKKLVSVD